MIPKIYEQIHIIFNMFNTLASMFRSQKNVFPTFYFAAFYVNIYIKSTYIQYFVERSQTQTIV